MESSAESVINNKPSISFLRARTKKAIIVFTSLMAAVSLMLWAISPYGFFSFNFVSDSLPGYVYFVVKGAPKHIHKGELIAFWPNHNPFTVPSLWFTKHVGGLPGDVVTLKGRDFYINGKYIAHAKRYSLKGVPLIPDKPGVIPKNHYFVYTNNPNSLDSRYIYIGLIPRDKIIGRSYRIL